MEPQKETKNNPLIFTVFSIKEFSASIKNSTWPIYSLNKGKFKHYRYNCFSKNRLYFIEKNSSASWTTRSHIKTTGIFNSISNLRNSRLLVSCSLQKSFVCIWIT